MARIPLVLSVGLASLAFAPAAQGAATYVKAAVPDWEQPYLYTTPGPGPNPNPGTPDPYDAWCAPTSAANLVGYWEDGAATPVADGVPFPGTALWGTAEWHDRELDQTRPPPGPAGPVTDVGWFMDTNNSGDAARGNIASPHLGTFVKDIHAGLADLLNSVSSGWTTGTQGRGFALGRSSSGALAAPHLDAASAFAEVVAEIDADRTVLIAWSHWQLVSLPFASPPPGPDPESTELAGYFDIVPWNPPAPAPPDPWDNDEVWEYEPENPKFGLGHVTTAVGYIKAGDSDDPRALLVNPTDWVIVHDNAPGTPPNVIVPLMTQEYNSAWMANINANRTGPVPALPAVALVALVVALAAITGLYVGRRALRS